MARKIINIFLSDENIITIANFEYVDNGIFLKLRKCRHKDIKGNFLDDGYKKYDVNQALNYKFIFGSPLKIVNRF